MGARGPCWRSRFAVQPRGGSRAWLFPALSIRTEMGSLSAVHFGKRWMSNVGCGLGALQTAPGEAVVRGGGVFFSRGDDSALPS